VTPEESLTASERAELDVLRARVAELEGLVARLEELEGERREEVAGAMAAVAAAQERAYWLDRWHVDLNRLVGTRAGATVRAVLRALRAPVRAARLLARRFRR
jgi:hypothetical protein